MAQKIIFLRPRVPAAWATNGGVLTPLSSVSTIQPSQVFRSDTLSGLQIDFDFGGGTVPDWDSIFVGYGNLGTAGPTVKFARATSQAGLAAASGNNLIAAASPWTLSGRPSSDDYPLLVSDQRYRGLHCFGRFPTVAQLRWGRAEFTEAGNTNGFLQFGRLIPALAIQPYLNFSFGWTIRDQDGGPMVRAETGAYHADDGPRWKAVKLPMRWIRQEPGAYTELQKLRELLRWAGKSSDIVVIADPDANYDWHDKTICGVVTQQREFTQSLPKWWQAELTIEELI